MSENPVTTSARLTCHGVDFPFDTSIITPRIARPMRNNRYEIGEVQALRDILKPEDRVLDLGAGIGLIAAVAARIVGSKNVTSVEANPALLPMIRSVLKMNDLDEVDLRHGIVAPAAAAPA